MATATASYHFIENTTDIRPQLAVNWNAIIPRCEKTYGNELLKQVAPDFRLGGTTWDQRLAALRKAAATMKVPRNERIGITGWLYDALLHEAGKGPHPGTSLLTVEVEPLKGGGVALPVKSEVNACKRFVARVLHDFAPDSPLGQRLAMKKPDAFDFDQEFTAVIRSEYATKQRGTFAVLGPSELLAPFAAGRGKDESYGI